MPQAFSLEVDVQVKRRIGSRFECLFRTREMGQIIHHILVEYKRPTKNLPLERNTGQMVACGIDNLAKTPYLGKLITYMIELAPCPITRISLYYADKGALFNTIL